MTRADAGPALLEPNAAVPHLNPPHSGFSVVKAVVSGYGAAMSRRRQRTIGIREVAQGAMVSVATASRVLSKSDYPVAEETRLRVERVARDLGFVPNAMARGLARARSDSIGVIVPVTNAYYDNMITGIETAARDRGLTMLLGLTQADEARREALVTQFLERRVDGIVVCAASHDQRLGRLPAQMPVPMVLVGQQPNAGYPMVRSDNVQAGVAAARHLYERGHRRFAYMTPQADWYDFNDRYKGLKAYLDAAGEPVSIALMDGVAGETGAYERIRSACASGLDATAIIASTDRHAIGTLAALADAGVSVPDEVAVMGFDNYLTSAYLRPSLTSVSMPAAEMGRLGVEHLWSMLNGGDVPEDTELQARLIVRQSTGGTAPRN
ncbi:MAG: LacI family DNA-binding transcriptional regulator [Devosia sp.]|uniref:LacI family DNA-binding transcriptional regulator n=1 Tax=Devosia sp. TaxID=1871048 RepID=UPI0024C635B5|nr:LacI family DNA-binding transcriptional regulator [Devosia sp.]UYN99144.1 MAG: LacI family DNA-binding transcriptional regulator [Devosia sp.]